MATCIPDERECRLDGSLGWCCSSICNQLRGRPRGVCAITPTSSVRPNNNRGGSNNGGSATTSSPTPTHRTSNAGDNSNAGATSNAGSSSGFPCISNGDICHQSGSLGFCCSGFCYQMISQSRGRCGPQILPEEGQPDEGRDYDSDNSTRTRSGLSTSVIIGICCAVFVIVLLIVIIFMLRRMRKNIMSKADIYLFLRGAPDKIDQYLPIHEKVDILPYDSSYEIPAGKFTIDNNQILGSGAFGIVKKGTVHQFPTIEPVHVAVKTTTDGVDVKYVKALLSELKLMIYIGTHENLVTLLGANTADLKKGTVYLFLELCSMGSLESYLRKHKNDFQSSTNRAYVNVSPNYEELNSKNLFLWSLQITKGLEYLSRKKVIHGDLATRNVLLTTRDNAKISDFGLSRRVYDYTNYVKKQQEPLPWKWMAIESLQELSFSIQSDVWALGVTIWEIFSLGSTPYPGLAWSTDFVQKLIENLRLRKPTHAPDELYAILCECWNPVPSARPTAEQIVRGITTISGLE